MKEPPWQARRGELSFLYAEWYSDYRNNPDQRSGLATCLRAGRNADVKPPPFIYLCPRTLAEAAEAAGRYADDGKLLAGGQSLMPVLNFRLANPTVLIDLNRVEGLSGIRREADGGLAIRALTRHRAVERSDDIREACPLLSAAMPHIGHVQIRNRGTIGGSLSHADPAAELPAVMLACDATFVASSFAGERTIAADRFFQGVFTTALEPGDILTEIRVPPWPRGRRFGFYEVTRRHGDFALAGAAVWIDGDDATCTAAKIVLFGVGDTPVRAKRAEQHLSGQAATPARIRESAAIAATELTPGSDIHASAEYRLEVGAVVVRRALEQAFGRGNGAHA